MALNKELVGPFQILTISNKPCNYKIWTLKIQRPTNQSNDKSKFNFSIIFNVSLKEIEKSLTPDCSPETKFKDFPLGYEFINYKMETCQWNF